MTASEGPSDADFATTLVGWQRGHGREALPWQQLGDAPDARDPYRIWLAEIMLQQTQVAAVIPYYRRFLDRFPDVASLARAPVDDAMHAWSGLGYYSRARNLHAAAKRVVDDFGGRFPDTVEGLAALPGVGRSTAAAIAAFAYGRRAAILDGNVKRVLSRLFLIDGPPSGTAFTKRAWRLAEALVPERDVERYTQGLMDLGATVCTPRRPTCLVCPFEPSCAAHRAGREEDFPERTARRPVRERRATLLYATCGGDVLLERRPATGIWGGLWSLPESVDLAGAVARAGTLGLCDGVEQRAGFRHAFTHFVLDAEVARVRVLAEAGRVDRPTAQEPDAARWIARDALDAIGLPTPIRTLLATTD